MSRDEVEIRLDNVEIAIVELTTLNKAQVDSGERQSKAVDSILSAIEHLSSTQMAVANNTRDINRLDEKVEKIFNDISVKEAAMNEKINHNRDELKSQGSERLIHGIMIATAIASGMFGYIFIKVERNSEMLADVSAEYRKDIKEHSALESQLAQNIAVIMRDIQYFKDKDSTNGH